MSTENRSHETNVTHIPPVVPPDQPSAIELLDRWLRDDSGYDEETWPDLKAALDRDRLSARRLFDG